MLLKQKIGQWNLCRQLSHQKYSAAQTALPFWLVARVQHIGGLGTIYVIPFEYFSDSDLLMTVLARALLTVHCYRWLKSVSIGGLRYERETSCSVLLPPEALHVSRHLLNGRSGRCLSGQGGVGLRQSMLLYDALRR